MDLSLAHGNYGAAARLVTVVVVQADLTEGRQAHLLFTRPESLRPRTTVDGSGHLAHDVFKVPDIFE